MHLKTEPKSCTLQLITLVTKLLYETTLFNYALGTCTKAHQNKCETQPHTHSIKQHAKRSNEKSINQNTAYPTYSCSYCWIGCWSFCYRCCSGYSCCCNCLVCSCSYWYGCQHWLQSNWQNWTLWSIWRFLGLKAIFHILKIKAQNIIQLLNLNHDRPTVWWK